MNAYERYIATNNKLARGERVFFSQTGVSGAADYVPDDYDRVLNYPKIGIYTGKGTSHSWLWFVDLFDRLGFYDITLLNEDHIKAVGLREIDVLAMSGGDTFAMAEGLGERGAEKLEDFIRSGGLYIGSCAGAYLPLYSSKTHLNLFNYVEAKITNLATSPPKVKTNSEKFCTPYGCSFIFHPVRESVRLTTNGFIPFKGVKSFLAPLYGGPPMVSADPSQNLATYTGFTDKTLFLVDEELARKTLLGKAAVVRKKMGSGHLYLFGPHFEHPHFPIANRLMANAVFWDTQQASAPKESAGKEHIVVQRPDAKALLRDIKREISNSRIVAAGMETLPVMWAIRNKIYEPAKIRVFLEAIWVRIKILEREDRLEMVQGQYDLIVRSATEATSLLREIKGGIDAGVNTLNAAKQLFEVLNKSCTVFLEIYFRTKMNRFKEQSYT